MNLELLDAIAQVGMAVFGLAAIVLVSRKNKWGFVLGLISQPFFFITAVANEQLGLFILCIAYTISWAYGIYEWFFKTKKNDKSE